jgi:hypothetical protein
MTPSGLSPVVPAETVFAATAQTAQLVSKSNVRGFMVTVGKLTRHACAARMVCGPSLICAQVAKSSTKVDNDIIITLVQYVNLH